MGCATFLLAGRSLAHLIQCMAACPWDLSAEELPVCAWMHTCVCKGMLLLPLPVVRLLFLCPSQVTFLFISFLPLFSYGRVYTADPYHALAPAASYGVGAVVSGIFFSFLCCFSFPAWGTAAGYCAMKPHPENFFVEGGGP